MLPAQGPVALGVLCFAGVTVLGALGPAAQPGLDIDAAGAAVLAFALPLKLNILTAILVATLACLGLEHLRARTPRTPQA